MSALCAPVKEAADSAFAHNAALGDWVYAKYPTLKNRTIGGMQGGTGGGLRGGAAYAQAGKQVPTAPYPSGCTDPNVGEYCASSAADCTTFGGQPAFVGAAGSYVGGAAKLMGLARRRGRHTCCCRLDWERRRAARWFED